MALDKEFTQIPGTTVFDADQSRKGYWLNQFCMSLMKADNRARFKADERLYLDEWKGDITLTGHERLGSYGVGMTLAPVSYNVTVSRLRSSPMQCGCISDFR
jgi:Aromatic-ring-opening dioxygenase LigAB, LigA subunit